MSAENKIATIYKGEDFSLSCLLLNEDGGPYDLTGASEIVARFAKPDTSDLLLKKKSLSEIVVDSDEGGEITIKLLSADTALLKEMVAGNFDVTITTVAGLRICFFERKLTVKKAMA